MTTSAVVKFMQQTSEDTTLRQQLEALLGVGDGNISESGLDASESAALKGERAPQVVQFAAEHGFQFSADEMHTVIDAIQQYQTGQLSQQALSSLVGAKTAQEVETSKPGSNQLVKRLIHYLGKTYLGISPDQK